MFKLEIEFSIFGIFGDYQIIFFMFYFQKKSVECFLTIIIVLFCSCSQYKKITATNVYKTVVVLVLAGGAILGVEADIETSADLNLELELIRSRAAKTSFFMRTNNLPLRHGFCRFRGLKSSLRQRSREPIKATKQKFLNLSTYNKFCPYLHFIHTANSVFLF